jgi:general secretion pathway protein G
MSMRPRTCPRPRPRAGFTLVELLVVMALIALLLSIAIPRYMNSVEKSREAVLRANLHLTRQMLDKYYEDHGRYPDSLAGLVDRRYLRSVPQDPVTGSSETWVIVVPEAPEQGGVQDIRSGAAGSALDGSAYGEW